MKIIFLDIDGVLNTLKTHQEIYEEFKRTGQKRIEIDPKKVEYLEKIVKATNSLIVLSSSWKVFCDVINGKVIAKNSKMEELLQILKKHDLFIYDKTPKNVTGIRENEICEWLYDKNIDSFVIIDDEEKGLEMFSNRNLIKTNIEEGLCENHIIEAIDILNGKMIKKL